MNVSAVGLQGDAAPGPNTDSKLEAVVSAADRRRLLAITRKFVASADTQDQALALYVNSKVRFAAAGYLCGGPTGGQ